MIFRECSGKINMQTYEHFCIEIFLEYYHNISQYIAADGKCVFNLM